MHSLWLWLVDVDLTSICSSDAHSNTFLVALQGMDLIPEPKIVIAALNACRRVNDHSLAVRYLEAIKDKCATEEHKIWPYMMQEIGPTLKELGISTIEEMGYDKPELALKSVYDMHNEWGVCVIDSLALPFCFLFLALCVFLFSPVWFIS